VTVVFGHWSALGVVLRPNLIGLDSGCVWGGKLTAVCLDDRSCCRWIVRNTGRIAARSDPSFPRKREPMLSNRIRYVGRPPE
jgi:hypothetical protein